MTANTSEFFQCTVILLSKHKIPQIKWIDVFKMREKRRTKMLQFKPLDRDFTIIKHFLLLKNCATKNPSWKYFWWFTFRWNSLKLIPNSIDLLCLISASKYIYICVCVCVCINYHSFLISWEIIPKQISKSNLLKNKCKKCEFCSTVKF